MARNNSIPARTDLLKIWPSGQLSLGHIYRHLFHPSILALCCLCIQPVPALPNALGLNVGSGNHWDGLIGRSKKNKTTGIGCGKKCVNKKMSHCQKIPSHHQDDISDMQLKHAKTFPIHAIFYHISYHICSSHWKFLSEVKIKPMKNPSDPINRGAAG